MKYYYYGPFLEDGRWYSAGASKGSEVMSYDTEETSNPQPHDEEVRTVVKTNENHKHQPVMTYEVSYSGPDWNDNEEPVTFTIESGGFRFRDWLTPTQCRELIEGMELIISVSNRDLDNDEP